AIALTLIGLFIYFGPRGGSSSCPEERASVDESGRLSNTTCVDDFFRFGPPPKMFSPSVSRDAAISTSVKGMDLQSPPLEVHVMLASFSVTYPSSAYGKDPALARVFPRQPMVAWVVAVDGTCRPLFDDPGYA